MTNKYYNYRRNAKELNEEIIFCANSEERSAHYGKIQRVFKATEKTDYDHSEIIKIAVEFYQVSDEEAKRLVNPINIVDTAAAWDDVEFVNYVYDNTDYFSKFDGIITKDGAVFFEVTKDNMVETNIID